MDIKITDNMTKEEELLAKAYNVLGRSFSKDYANKEFEEKVNKLFFEIDDYFFEKNCTKVLEKLSQPQ
jgi:hypothetical protein